ncbi:MAG TPA: hypothetical protein VJ689_09940 [Gaiellaceae bacterium]|jgi:hypothetical protein|nr:hypothetical protein [Gaiellaceae bacterium]
MDVVFLLVLGAFFTLTVLLVRGCELLLGRDGARPGDAEEEIR